MTKEELNVSISRIEQNANEQKNEVYLRYARENAKYKVGDIIKCNGNNIIRVEKVTFSIVNRQVLILYRGPRLTQRLAPCKKNEILYVYEGNVLEKKR